MATDSSYVTHLDRRLTESSTGVSVAYDSGSNTTTWTLPYGVPTDGSQGTLAVCVRSGTLARLTVTRPATNQVATTGDYHTAQVYIGLLYAFTYVLSPIFMRLEKGATETRGRLQLQYITFELTHTTDLTVTISQPGYSNVSYTYSDPTAAPVAKFTVPIKGRAEFVTITVTDNTPGATRIAAWTWEGEYTLRARPT